MASKTQRARRSGRRRKPRKTEARVAHTVLHPVRLDILSILLDRVASTGELAKMLGKSRSTVSRHIMELRANQVIEVAGEEPRRGAMERYYRATAIPEISPGELEGLPRAARRKLAAVALQGVVTESLASLRHGRMDADDELRLTMVPMALSPRGREEVEALQGEMLDRLEAIGERDADRPKAALTPVKIAALMCFDRGRPEGASSDARADS